MQALSPLARYQRILEIGEYQADAIQHQAVTQLDQIFQAIQQKAAFITPKNNLPRKFRHWLHGRFTSVDQPPIRGLYMWGGVGRGKTWLMDLFFDSLPGDRKLRLHFHRFMQRVHSELAALEGRENPLEIVADRFKTQTDVLCFDEFFVSDITDAMLLATLLQALFARGVTLVATSNTLPDELYRHGLQRQRFLPAIALIKEYCDVMNVDAGIDYRLRTLTPGHLYLAPLTPQTQNAMDDIFSKLAGKTGDEAPVLQINHRPLPALRTADGVLAVDFQILCKEPRSQLDYIEISRFYHSVLLHNVRIMGPEEENTACRFLALVDEFYERHVKLVISAEVSMEKIYQGDRLKFEFQRCLSRLKEMQSKEYLALPHLP